jgi:hypothetical protein
MLNNAAQTGNLAVPADALYNFKLLSALRADDPQAVQPFLDQLGSSNDASRDVKAGLLLAMAVRIASGQSIFHQARRKLTGSIGHPTYITISLRQGSECTNSSWIYHYRSTCC